MLFKVVIDEKLIPNDEQIIKHLNKTRNKENNNQFF